MIEMDDDYIFWSDLKVRKHDENGKASAGAMEAIWQRYSV